MKTFIVATTEPTLTRKGIVRRRNKKMVLLAETPELAISQARGYYTHTDGKGFTDLVTFEAEEVLPGTIKFVA